MQIPKMQHFFDRKGRKPMKRMKSAVCFLFAAAILLLSACGGPYKGKNNDVSAILRPLAEKETVLLRYLYGDGFKTMNEVAPEDAEYTTTAKYYRVSADSPYHSVAQLKTAIREVYSADRAKEIESGLFENAGGFSRFNDYQITDLAGEVTGTDLGIDVTLNHPPRELFTVILPDQLEVTRSTAALIECEVGYTDSRSGKDGTMTLTLVQEDGKWLLDNSTWAGSVE